jgi:ubiquinone/menaquinone biosynthesis C-methylase UbiE
MTIGYIGEAYNELHKQEQLIKLRIILNELDLKKEDYVLDLGCGTGFSLDYYNCKVIGVEPNKELIKQSKHKLIHASAENIPFNNKEFTHTIVLSAFHHFRKEAINEIKRVTKKIAVITVVKGLTNYGELIEIIRSNFKVIKQIEESKDSILFVSIQ